MQPGEGRGEWECEVVEEPSHLYESWVTRVRRYSGKLVVAIPEVIAERMGLKWGDAVVVAVRRAEEGEEPWSGTRGRAVRYGDINVVVCPRCGMIGRLYVLWSKPEMDVRVTHWRRACYLGSLRSVAVTYPELRGVIRRMMELKASPTGGRRARV